MAELSELEQDQLLKLLEEEDVIEPPTIVFTVRHIGSKEPTAARSADRHVSLVVSGPGMVERSANCKA